MSYIRYLLLSVYFLIMKFSIILELIIVFPIFLSILIFIYSWVVFVKAVSLLTRAVLQYFFWLLLSEESSSFPLFPKDVSSGWKVDRSDKILYISYVRSGSRNYPLYRIVTMFVCSSWSIFLIKKSLLVINLKIGFSRKILIISFIDKMYQTYIIHILIPIVTIVFYRRLWIIICVIFPLQMGSISIIIVICEI